MHDYDIIEAFYSLFGITVVALGKQGKHDVNNSRKNTDAPYLLSQMVL